METREEIATRIHTVYIPNDTNCSFTDKDWYVAKEIAELQAETEKIKNKSDEVSRHTLWLAMEFGKVLRERADLQKEIEALKGGE